MATFDIQLANSRHFLNPFLNSTPAVVVDDAWLSAKIATLASRICARSLQPEEFEKGPYTGISGTAFALLKANEALGKRAEQNYADYVEGLLHEIAKRKLSSRRLGRYLTGSVGDYVVQAICLHKLGAPTDVLLAKLREEAREMVKEGENEDEILNGRAGYLAGVLALKTENGVNLLPDSELKAILDVIIASGRHYAKASKSKPPLMFEWHDKEYLGAAHGLSGILQMLLSFWHLLDQAQRGDVKQTVDWFLGIQQPDGNFPSSTGRIGHIKGEEDELVHWCHGATGAVHLLIAAHLALKEDKYLQAARKCADLIWLKGLLRKGPGICHGVAGSGYAFLLLFRLTRAKEYLQRAKAFALFMMDPRFEKAARVPDMPWSLYEGWSGALCFLVDLFKPDKAQFPLVPIPFAK